MDEIERVARAICKSKTFEGAWCCQHPANMGRRHACPVTAGNYDDAARAAVDAMRESTEAIAIAVLAERERCADIADNIVQPGTPGTVEWIAMGNFAGAIRDAILFTSFEGGE